LYEEILQGETTEIPDPQRQRKHRVLVVDDDPIIRELVRETLEGERFQVLEAGDGAEGMRLCSEQKPDLVILDVMMPGQDGLEVLKKLREDTFTSHIPIILLTAKGMVEDKVRGIETGADDYITKPFDPLELEARVIMHIRRSIRDGEASPLTGLPGNRAIEETIEERIRKGIKFAVAYVDLDDFKAYNDKYGFHRGSEVIKMTARCIAEAVEKYGDESDFIGHIGGDDFIVVTDMVKAPLICQEIIRLFDTRIPAFYDPEDREKGYIVSRERSGKISRFPIMTVSISVVHNTYRVIDHPGKVAQIAAELKKYAKAQKGSVFVFDRRRSG
jgi:PleD family two-component response regulator